MNAREQAQHARGRALERQWQRHAKAAREGIAPKPPRKPHPAPLKPFMGVDGEGGGRNRHGQQHFKLLRAGPYELYTGRPLSTLQCLEFIASLPRDCILVGFSVGYDFTQILRDLTPERLARLFAEKERGQGKSPYLYFDRFAIDFMPGQYLRVARTEIVRETRDNVVHFWRKKIPGSDRTIWETFGFFQSSFLKALQAWEVGKEHWPTIERNKMDRDKFSRMTREIRRYNQIECDLLAEMMEQFRAMCHESGVHPQTWNGAGKLAAALHKQHKTITAKEIAKRVPDGVLVTSSAAFYGGRFETMYAGLLPGPIHEHDIGSAYPAAMPELPCLLHGDWQEMTGKQLHRLGPKALFVAELTFNHEAPDIPWCGFPVRLKNGHLLWPRQGAGTYWSTEIRAAERIGASVRYQRGWRYVQRCQCQACDWVEPLYNKRISLGKNKRGLPLKLGTNSLYGKFVQRVGNSPWKNMVWGSLITATTRARLIDAAASAPYAVIMFATDAVFSREKLAVPIGDELGQWGHETHKSLFIVQPGFYWGAKRPKTRGMPLKELEKHTAKFEAVWRKFMVSVTWSNEPPPYVMVPLRLFVGLKLAYARARASTKDERKRLQHFRSAGSWIDTERRISFEWRRKRAASPTIEDSAPDAVRTEPQPGGPDLVSVAHHDNDEAWHRLNISREELADQPDYVDLSNPYRD
jgi:hypothetical protein